MKHKISLFLLIAALAVTCIGCGIQSQPGELQQEQPKQEQQPETESNDAIEDNSANSCNFNPTNGDELFAISRATGSVTEFFDGGCKITPTFSDGEVAYEAAPGYENEDDYITVSYNDDCIFQIVYVNIQTGAAEYETSSSDNVKRQTRLVICGDYDSNNVLNATHVFIYRNAG